MVLFPVTLSGLLVRSVQPKGKTLIDSNGKNGNWTSRRGTIWPWVFGICNHCKVMTAWGRNSGNWKSNFCIFWKTTPYGKIFKILFRKSTWRHRSTLLCSNVVKSFRQEIGEIVRYLPDQKKRKFRLPLKLSLLCGSRPRSARASRNIWLTMFQISSKSVHLRRSYSRTREGHSFGQYSISNIRLRANNNNSSRWQWYRPEVQRRPLQRVSLPSTAVCIPVAVESFGPLADDAHRFATEIGRRMTFSTADPRETAFLYQRISVAVQRYNAVCLANTSVSDPYKGHYHSLRHHRRRQ